VRVIESTATGQINNWLLFLKVLINRNSQVGHHVGVIPSSYGDKSARHGDRWPPAPAGRRHHWIATIFSTNGHLHAQ
jgi:hypothetical protein